MLFTSPRWLLRVFARGTMARRSFVISSPTSPAINGWRPCDSGRGRPSTIATHGFTSSS
jgi:hypothetical protein